MEIRYDKKNKVIMGKGGLSFLKRTRRLIPERLYRYLLFYFRVGYWPDFDHPKTLNEKICWLKFNYKDDLYPILADKLKVRGFVEERVGCEHLNRLFFSTKDPEMIPFERLPQNFVIKSNHGSGQVLFVDKSNFNKEEIIATCKSWLKKRYSPRKREWVYNSIDPHIVIEEMMLDRDGNVPTDYKFYISNGEVIFIQVHQDRFNDHRIILYDEKWNPIDAVYSYKKGYEAQRPCNFEKMKAIAFELSKGFPFCRVDLYSYCEKVIFGEMTFFPGSGMEPFLPRSADLEMGSKIKIEV